MRVFEDGKTFEKADFRTQTLPTGDYENCVFKDCDFSTIDLSETEFESCEFIGCNLSLAKISKTAFREIRFKDCKMLGARFDTCNPFGLSFSFDKCNLTHSIFYKLKIKKTIFRNCLLQEVDFAESDLTNVIFDDCDLISAVFENTILEKTDFRSSFHYSIDPEKNKIRKARFSWPGLRGLLDKYDLEIED